MVRCSYTNGLWLFVAESGSDPPWLSHGCQYKGTGGVEKVSPNDFFPMDLALILSFLLASLLACCMASTVKVEVTWKRLDGGQDEFVFLEAYYKGHQGKSQTDLAAGFNCIQTDLSYPEKIEKLVLLKKDEVTRVEFRNPVPKIIEGVYEFNLTYTSGQIRTSPENSCTHQ